MTKMINRQALQKQDSDRLYNLYVKPLEKEHKGKYATVDLTGEIIIASNLLESIQKADDKFGSKQTITFKVGDKVVGKIR